MCFFLEKFGGNNPFFLENIRLNASFEELKYLYSCDVVLPEDSCYFCNTELDVFAIRQSDGVIYSFYPNIITKNINGQEVYDYVEFQAIEIEYGGIDSVLFHGLMINICLPKFSLEYSSREVTNEEIQEFIRKNKEYSFPNIYILMVIYFS